MLIFCILHTHTHTHTHAHTHTHTHTQVIVNERAVRAIAIVNTGSLAYDFEWDIGTNPRVSVRARNWARAVYALHALEIVGVFWA